MKIKADIVTIDQFWNNTAHFELVSKSRFEEYGMTAMNVGFHFVTRGGTFYLFHSEYGFDTLYSTTPTLSVKASQLSVRDVCVRLLTVNLEELLEGP